MNQHVPSTLAAICLLCTTVVPVSAQSEPVVSREMSVKTAETWDGIGSPVSREVTVKVAEAWDGIGSPVSREVTVNVAETWDGIGVPTSREVTVNTLSLTDYATVSRELTLCAPVYVQADIAAALRIAAGLQAATDASFRLYNVVANPPSGSAIDIVDVLRLAYFANTPAAGCDQ